MAVRNPDSIRNITLTGGGGCGKTTLTERLLFKTGVITRMGSVEEKNTVSDYTDEEKHAHHSLSATPVFFEHDGVLVNLIDTPGMGDFVGHAVASLPACESCVVMIDATKGIEPVTRRIMNVAADRNLPRLIIINKIDDRNSNCEGVVEAIKAAFGAICLPINLPAAGGTAIVNVFEHEDGESDFSSPAEAHTRILEQVVEVNPDLMSEYLEKGGEGLDHKKVHEAFEQALREAHLVPICFVSAKSGVGIDDLLNIFTHYCPSPEEGNPRPFFKTDDAGGKTEFHAEPKADGELLAHVFRVTSDPFVGKLGVFKVHQGIVRAKSEVYIDDGRKAVRIGHLFKLRGKEHVECDAIGPGDIGCVAKVDEVHFNSVMHAHSGEHISLRPLPMPKPMYGLAVELKNHKDESKFSPAVGKLMAEDPCFIVERIAATKQTVARGIGEMHVRVMLERLKSTYGIDVETATPKVAYKETIAAKGDGHHRHKKQSGGSGEFGEVYLRVMPLPSDHPEGFEFENATVGGSIPKQFMPAIEKGIRQVLADGAIAGFPMTGVRVEVYDGKHHPVDSKEVAFTKAGKRAFVEAVQKAKPVLLEPFVLLEVTIPNKYMGDITGDLSTKRGRVQDTEMVGDDTCIIKAVAPLSELQNYSNELKSITGGAGAYSMDFSHTEQTPAHLQAEVVAAFKPHGEED